MDSMRDLLKKNLGRSLESLPELDRLETAWPVACGKVLAARGRITGFTENVVNVLVEHGPWLEQLRSMRGVLEVELARISGVKLAAIHFELNKPPPRNPRPAESVKRVR